MKHSWKFGQQLFATSPKVVPPVFGRNYKEVLIEYNGPRLVLLEEHSMLFLSLCIDEDGSGTRWIQSRISQLEYQALMGGALAVRDALLKPGMTLLESAHDEALQHAWQLNPRDIPEEILPEPGALLPEYVRASFRTDMEPDVAAEFHIGAEGGSGNRISFARLSKATATLQHVWTSLASTLGTEQITLNAVGLRAGSFKVRVEVDNPNLYKRIANVYGELTRATYDEIKLVETLSRLPPSVVENYSQYLSALNVNQLDVLAEWREDAVERIAFVGYAGAQRTRKSIKSVKSTSDVKRWIETLTGYFEGFSRSPRHFEFYDQVSGNRVSGKIQKSLRDTPITGELHLGHRLKYRAEIEMVQKSTENPKSTLLAFAPIQD